MFAVPRLLIVVLPCAITLVGSVSGHAASSAMGGERDCPTKIIRNTEVPQRGGHHVMLGHGAFLPRGGHARTSDGKWSVERPILRVSAVKTLQAFFGLGTARDAQRELDHTIVVTENRESGKRVFTYFLRQFPAEVGLWIPDPRAFQWNKAATADPDHRPEYSFSAVIRKIVAEGYDPQLDPRLHAKLMGKDSDKRYEWTRHLVPQKLWRRLNKNPERTVFADDRSIGWAVRQLGYNREVVYANGLERHQNALIERSLYRGANWREDTITPLEGVVVPITREDGSLQTIVRRLQRIARGADKQRKPRVWGSRNPTDPSQAAD